MSEKPDWEAIRSAYEQGNVTIRELAATYNVPTTTLYRRSLKWNGTERNAEKVERNGTQPQEVPSLRILRTEFPSPPGAIEGANLGLDALVTYLRTNRQDMDLADHVKAATALSQYNRIIVNAPPEELSEVEQEDFSGFTDDELRLYAELQERAKKRA